MPMAVPLLNFMRVSKTFDNGRFRVNALDDVTFDVAAGETVALVGESGSGKTTLAKIILGLEAASGGKVEFKGQPLSVERSLDDRRRIQLVQQNPYLTLNPARSIGRTLGLPLRIHYRLRGGRSRKRIAELLDLVGLPADLTGRYPRNMSGGQRQRIALARALACQPELLILDEPTSALDVSVQARVLALFADLQSQLKLTYLFITHDLAVARALANKVAVLYRGQLVEFGIAAKVLTQPAHPYTASLLASVPVLSDTEERLKPRVVWREAGAAATKASEDECAFRGQCWKATDFCAVRPAMRPSGADSAVACYHPL
jgi:oligopeptide/dipeptide ABC transporter ATP-binding protein